MDIQTYFDYLCHYLPNTKFMAYECFCLKQSKPLRHAETLNKTHVAVQYWYVWRFILMYMYMDIWNTPLDEECQPDYNGIYVNPFETVFKGL